MLKLILSIGGIIGFFLGWFVFNWLPSHPEYGEKIFYFLVRLIPFAFSWKKRKVIEKEIHAYVTEEIKSVNSESYGFKILPKGIRIEWTLKKDEEVIIEENEIVIRLGIRENSCENFVDALMLYLVNSFMPQESIYLEPALCEACRFQIAISMLRKRGSEYYKVFIDKYYKPALEKYKEILNYSRKLESIEKSGLFTSIFLPTISFYTDKWISQMKTPCLEIHQEIIELLDFIHNIVIRKEYEEETGEKPPIDYQKKYLRMSIIPVARKELREKSEYRPHLEKAKEKLKREVDILFITGRGKNAGLAEVVAYKLRKELFCEQIDGVSKFAFYPEESIKIEGICCAFKRKG